MYDSQGRVSTKFTASATNQAPVKDMQQTRYSQYYYTLLSGSRDDSSATNIEPRATYEGWRWSQFARHYLVRRPEERVEADAQAISTDWYYAANQFTTNRIYTNGPFTGMPRNVFRPDGTATCYSYGTNATQRIETVLEGQPDPANADNVIDGTKIITITGLAGEILSRTTCAVPQTNMILAQEVFSNFDELYRPGRVTFLDGTYKEMHYTCCGLGYEIDRDGTRTDYGYDALKRLTTVTRNGITTLTSYDGAGRVVATYRQGTNSMVLIEGLAYDAAGRLVARSNALNQVTQYFEFVQNNQPVKVTINPDGGTITNYLARDGSLLEVAGTSTAPRRYEYGIAAVGGENRRFTTETLLANDGGTNEWVKTWQSPLDINFRTEYAAAQSPYPSVLTTNNLRGFITNQIDPDGVITLYAYNGKGEREYTIADTNRNYAINYNGTDQISRVFSQWTTNSHGYPVKRTLTYAWSTFNSAVSNLVSSVEVSTDGLREWRTVYQNGAAATTSVVTAYDRANARRTVTQTNPNDSYTVSTYEQGRLVSVQSYDATGLLAADTCGYDEHGRQNRVTNSRTGETAYTFDAADRVVTITTPPPADGQSAQTTTRFYDAMGRVWRTVLPDETSVTNEYTLQGQVRRTYGSRTYPVEYEYDSQGRMRTLKTWQNFANDSGAAITTWNYDPYRGWLTNKIYNGTPGPSYSYTAAGRLAKRVWARGIETIYAYGHLGELRSVNYSDTTPDVTFAYDRQRRQTLLAQSGGLTANRLYSTAGALLSEAYSSGVLSGLTVTNSYDHLLRRTNLTLRSSSTVLSATAYGYDPSSRIAAVSQPSVLNFQPVSASYSYLANTPLVSQIAFSNNGQQRMTTSKTYDFLNRLLAVSSAPSASSAVSFEYYYNSANQRTRSELADGSYWVYEYDSLGQATSGKKYWFDGTPVAGQQFEYAFDDIGNRTSTAAGGDENGANLRSADYSANLLNQYTSRTVPGYVDVQGSALASATVSLWGDNGAWSAASRKGEYFRGELAVTNTAAPVWLGITNLAVLNTATNDLASNLVAKAFVPRTPEAFYYDADGNLTNDGRWYYAWDAENRLVWMGACNTNPAIGPQQWLEFGYDWQGRRISKKAGPVGSSTPTNEVRFVYDGWNLIAILNSSFNILNSFTWGLDLSGSLQEAGGVGGLLWVNNSGDFSTHFASFDGNGNVVALFNATDASESGRYEYGPFGEVLRATGDMARVSPFRYSTKYQDDETDLLYYGYRYYKASTGTWLSRDPLEEMGGANLYDFVGNDSIDFWDALGLRKRAEDLMNPQPLSSKEVIPGVTIRANS